MKTIIKDGNIQTVFYNDEDPSIGEIQKLVGGYAGHIYWKDSVVVFDERGIEKNYEYNLKASAIVGIGLVGNVGIIAFDKFLPDGETLQ